MTLEQIKDTPKGTYFTFINDYKDQGWHIHGSDRYVIMIIRKINFITRQSSGAWKTSEVTHELRYTSVRASTSLASTTKENVAIMAHEKDTTIPVTSKSAESFYSQKSKDFTKVKQMIIRAPFLSHIKSVEFHL